MFNQCGNLEHHIRGSTILLYLAIHLPHTERQSQAVRKEARGPTEWRAKAGKWGFHNYAEGRRPSVMSQDITNEPRTDAGKKGTPAKEFRQKWMITRASDMPSSSDHKRSAVERFQVRNQTQIPNEAHGPGRRVVVQKGGRRMRRVSTNGQDGRGRKGRWKGSKRQQKDRHSTRKTKAKSKGQE